MMRQVSRGGAVILPLPRLGWSLTHARDTRETSWGIHVVYALEVPIARHNASHTLPLAYLAHVADRLSHHLGADPGYTGLIPAIHINPGPECLTPIGPDASVQPARA